MHLKHTVIAVAASAALVFSAIPAHAQRRGGGDHAAHRSGGSHQSPQQAAPQAAARPAAPRVERSAPAPRGGFVAGARINRAAPRAQGFRNGVVGPRSSVVVPYSRGSYAARGAYRPTYNYRGYHRSFFSYYSFRPRVNLGFGLWVGYPFAYRDYYYYDPYQYYVTPGDPYVYDYAAPSYGYPAPPPPADESSAYPTSAYPPPAAPSSAYPDENAAPPEASQQAPGGVSFEITPDDAAVFVDGTYVGTVGSFSPNAQPLGLTPGRHHIEVRAQGYRTMSFDTDVIAGQVIPYRGTLSR